MIRGSVKWFDEEKGYGFLRSDAIDADIFVHYSKIGGGERFKKLEQGEEVEFRVHLSEKGLSASDVVRV